MYCNLPKVLIIIFSIYVCSIFTTRNAETLLFNYFQSFLNRMLFLLYSHARKINLERDSINAFTRKCGYLRTGSKCSFMQEISSHAFTRNDWLCLYLSLVFAVLERCANFVYEKVVVQKDFYTKENINGKSFFIVMLEFIYC